jgi:hypothetical protein
MCGEIFKALGRERACPPPADCRAKWKRKYHREWAAARRKNSDREVLKAAARNYYGVRNPAILRRCVICETDFWTGFRRAKTCSVDCRKKYEREQRNRWEREKWSSDHAYRERRLARNRRSERLCPICGAALPPGPSKACPPPKTCRREVRRATWLSAYTPISQTPDELAEARRQEWARLKRHQPRKPKPPITHKCAVCGRDFVASGTEKFCCQAHREAWKRAYLALWHRAWRQSLDGRDWYERRAVRERAAAQAVRELGVRMDGRLAVAALRELRIEI